MINQGNGKFETVSLPDLAQLTPYRAAQIIDVNGDKLPDVLLYGNYFGNNIQLGRYDSDYGKILINKGNCHFEVQYTEGVQIRGEVRRMLPVTLSKKNKGKTFVLGINNEKVRIINVE